MTYETFPLTPAQLELLHAFAEVLTPGGDGFPTAAEADPDGAVLALAIHHMHGQMLEIAETLNAGAGKDPRAFLEELESEEPHRFEQVRSLLVCRYLTCRPVWSILGYSGQTPSPPLPGEAELYLRDGILDPVVRRGPIYIPTPH
jgi:hypothetical protein